MSEVTKPLASTPSLHSLRSSPSTLSHSDAMSHPPSDQAQAQTTQPAPARVAPSPTAQQQPEEPQSQPQPKLSQQSLKIDTMSAASDPAEKPPAPLRTRPTMSSTAASTLHERHSADELPRLSEKRTRYSEGDPITPTFASTPNLYPSRHHSLDLDDYFTGPRDIAKHSKWPIFLRMHGSILPKMIIPLLSIGAWASAITLANEMNKHKYTIGINPVLLTVTGFVVGLGLSFRSSTAYERYTEGRKYWMQLILASQQLGRIFWIHSRNREPENNKLHLLHTMTAANMIVAFAMALKHKLRFEPYTSYEDLSQLVGHLDTYAGTASAHDPAAGHLPPKNRFKSLGENLGVSFAESNPRKLLKKAQRPLGNLPLEILNYLARYIDCIIEEGKLSVPIHQTVAFNNLTLLNDALTGCERVLTTPLPIAYTIAINQITWVYVLLLPFQLVPLLHWITIPATIAASYIIMGILFIGREIENPFGNDVNDLPLETYCEQVADEMDIVAARSLDLDTMLDRLANPANMVLFPASQSPFTAWAARSEARLRAAIRAKHEVVFQTRAEQEAKQEAAQSAGFRNRSTAAAKAAAGSRSAESAAQRTNTMMSQAPRTSKVHTDNV